VVVGLVSGLVSRGGGCQAVGLVFGLGQWVGS
jgi:hypothetical protein